MANRLLTPSNLKFARFEVKGLEEYATRLINAGQSIDDAVAEGIEIIKEGVREDIADWAEKHKLSGAVAEGVTSTEVIRDGNMIYAEVGIDSNVSKNSWHAVFVEYGTATTPADPGVRRAFKKWQSKKKAIFKRIFEKRGLPHD